MNVGIVGAGPAGLTAAIAAARLGLSATVYERADDARASGGGIALQSNGLRVLERLGLLGSFEQSISACRKIVLELPGGHEVVNDYGQLTLRHNYVAIVLRQRLQEHLLAAARGAVQVRFGHRCVGVQVAGRHALLQFANGESAECDVVIGADGAHSQVRRSLNVNVVRESAGNAYLRGVSDLACPQALIREIWGRDARRFGIAPLRDGRSYFYCSAPRGAWEQVRREGLNAWLGSWEPYGARVEEVLRRVADWKAVNYDEAGQVRIARWSSPPVFLIGDAAHEMTPDYGQGANSAMVDAVVLVSLIARASTLEQAAMEYDSVRRPFVDRTQRAAWRVGVASGWTSPLARWLRDWTIRSASNLRPLTRRDLLLIAGYNPREQQYL